MVALIIMFYYALKLVTNKGSEIYNNFLQFHVAFFGRYNFALNMKFALEAEKKALPSHKLVDKIWNFAVRRVILSACLVLMLLCQPYRTSYSVRMTTCLNFGYHQLVNLTQKALDTVQWYNRWLTVYFSLAHNEQMSLSVMPARKKAGFGRYNALDCFKPESN